MYAVVGWLLVQLAGELQDALSLPDWFAGLVVSLLLLGFPIAILFAWAFDLTPEGVKRTEASDDTPDSGKGFLDFAIVGGLVVIGGLLIGQRFLGETASRSPSELVDTASNPVPGSLQSIAVLPFEDFSPAGDQEYFSDGISEELLNVLSRVDGLRVASRTSSFSFKARNASVSEIAQALNVEHILEGSIRKAGETLRITAQLINATSDEHIWSDTYDRPLTAENIFKIQDEISQAIVLELYGQLDILPNTADRPTDSTEAYEAFLKGREAYADRTVDGINDSIDWLTRATTLDPEFAVAHAKLARAHTLQREYGALPPRHSNFRAKTHIERALSLAPNDWDVLSERAWMMFGRRDNPLEQLRAFDSAIEANPNNASAYRGKGLMLLRLGNIDGAFVAQERALELDPESLILKINYQGTYRSIYDRDGAERVIRDALRISPTFPLAKGVLASSFHLAGNTELAHRVAKSCEGEIYCDDALTSIYSTIGLPDLIPDPDNGVYARALQAARDRNDAELKTIFEQDNDLPPSVIVSFSDLANRPDQAYAIINEREDWFKVFLTRTDERVEFETDLVLLWALEAANDARADELRKRLSVQLANLRDREFPYSAGYIASARWFLMNDDIPSAVDALSRMYDAGFFAPVGLDERHWASALIESSEYALVRKKMQARVGSVRQAIEDQLQSPPDPWWDPAEFLE
ncbi:MAG: hypothetical protein AAFR07_02525 [Pseudomonadota bacterium]